jgi:hypothetical protein
MFTTHFSLTPVQNCGPTGGGQQIPDFAPGRAAAASYFTFPFHPGRFTQAVSLSEPNRKFLLPAK